MESLLRVQHNCALFCSVLNFFTFMAAKWITQPMNRDALQVYINSLDINRLTRLRMLCFVIATEDANS